MAGEIEDSINFQVDCLPTGSISFGRFEAESLCWERRSSFSHNRYLEEVEKCSKPGSVIEKKAYFEAHFKRKALLREASSECQNEVDEQTTSENEILDHMNYMEEFEEHGNEGAHFAHYDESLDGSDEHKYEVMEFEREEEEILPYEFHLDSIPTNANARSDEGIQHIEVDETLQTPFVSEITRLVNEDSKTEVEQKLADEIENSKIEVDRIIPNEAENVDGLLKRGDASIKSHTSAKDHIFSLEKQQKTSLKVRITTEQKATKPKVTAQVPRKTSNEKTSFSSVKTLTKNPLKMERDSPLRTNREKRSPSKVPQTKCSVSKNVKSEDSENAKAKLSQDIRSVHNIHISDNDLKAKKIGATPQPASGKGDSVRHQSGNRPKRTTNSTKPDLKASGAVFNFKSDERAEKRKEFYMRLEEKMHAKEAETNQIQARTQEEIQAEIKQLRRSLNFKATPMPTFYHEPVPQGSDSKKVTIPCMKSPKLRSKSTSPGSRDAAQENTRAFSKPTNQQDLSNCESPSRAQPQVQETPASEANAECPVTSNESDTIYEVGNSNRISQCSKRIEAGKKERSKATASIQQHGNNKMRKGERVKATRVGVGKGEIVGKAMKSLVGGGSGMGHLAVDVAS
ncbi:protein WVD2-like 7 [Tasmannia lanceolata]|uniref:protein WVD2-like 7 n=1 Tax=Tasmannia lanceolata TaxID=3420 RepID=UPI004063D2A3